MTGLLVSVRSAAEARVALAGGADIIDVKEPSRGSLGAADPAVWQEVLAAVGRSAVTSVALGELMHDSVHELTREAVGFNYAKIGLASCGSRSHWQHDLRRAFEALPPLVVGVPVGYADWKAADAPDPRSLIDIAASIGARLLLIDTHDKSAGSLLHHWTIDSVAGFLDDAREKDIRVALAGSLDPAAVESLLALAPAYLGVRGAACRGGRSGAIDLARVKSLATAVQDNQSAPAF